MFFFFKFIISVGAAIARPGRQNNLATSLNYRVRHSLPLTPILSQLNPLQTSLPI